jgi:hypothetical protein
MRAHGGEQLDSHDILFGTPINTDIAKDRHIFPYLVASFFLVTNCPQGVRGL